MALQTGRWSISKEDLEAAIAAPPPSIRESFFEQMVKAERAHMDDGVRRALSLWVSELEPELMFRTGRTRPFGLTAKGHGTPYITIKWDDNFYLTGDPIRYPIERRRRYGLAIETGGAAALALKPVQNA